jgi:hypothetical protein
VFPKPKGLHLDLAGPAATHTLETMGAEKGSSNEVRALMRIFFEEVEKVAHG